MAVDMNVEGYLERIGYRGARGPSADVLRGLHRAHMHAVPFENLDIALGRPIVLSLAAFHDKIVLRQRGGFCYELNGLFASLLEQFGFDVTVCSARVFHGGVPGPEFDHMALVVGLPEGRFLADVGFGESFHEPLRLLPGEQVRTEGAYRLVEMDGRWILESRAAEEWQAQYDFSLTPRRLDEFDAMCRYQQTAPESIFVRKSVCSLATVTGRLTLSNGRFLVTSLGGREESEVASAAELRVLLATHFGIDLDADTAVERLLAKPTTHHS